jgi:transposase
VSTSEAQRIKDLEQENRELKRANVILGGVDCLAA